MRWNHNQTGSQWTECPNHGSHGSHYCTRYRLKFSFKFSLSIFFKLTNKWTPVWRRDRNVVLIVLNCLGISIIVWVFCWIFDQNERRCFNLILRNLELPIEKAMMRSMTIRKSIIAQAFDWWVQTQPFPKCWTTCKSFSIIIKNFGLKRILLDFITT